VSAEKGVELTNIREHFDTALNRALLDWDQPMAVIDPEHSLQQLHIDCLPGLTGRYKIKQIGFI